MENLKKGDLVKVIATGEELEVFFASTIEERFYILVKPGTGRTPLDENGENKYFFYPNELDYTDKQKEWMWYEAEHHNWEMQQI